MTRVVTRIAGGPGVPLADAISNPVSGIRAVLLDVDGTLYRQEVVRCRMALELAMLPLRGSVPAAHRVIRTIREFRKVREALRALGAPVEPLSALQFEETARRVGSSACEVERTISEWMFTRPLRHLASAKRPGVVGFLEAALRGHVLIGALSDYPVSQKVAALGLSRYFSIALCTTDPAVNALKPHARGFLEACRLWGLQPQEVLYVGDRPDVDANGARAVGMHAAIIEPGVRAGLRSNDDGEYLSVGGFAELETALATA